MAFEDKYLFNKNLSKPESKFDSSRLAITTLITNFSIRTPQYSLENNPLGREVRTSEDKSLYEK